MNAHSHIRRFFAPDLSDDDVTPHPSEVHHALHVLRLEDGDEVELFDGAGTTAVGVIKHVGRRSIVIRITARKMCDPPPGPAIQLAFAAPKGKRIDWLVEKATELGAASLQRVLFDRSPPAARAESPAKSDKLMAHCVSAAKQSGLNFLPRLPAPVMLAEILNTRNDSLRLLGDTKPDAISLPEAIQGGSTWDNITLLIGPEGGLTEDERSKSLAAGFIPVRIAQTILRTETAAVAMLAAVVASAPLT
ncbi:MAG: RsmE family RNA methyltransferase [Phycisphaerae bacterium]|jgi:16S rRNA (uracil1498-N3)-methyltransferase|nr:RsmE family RNA methyltransferase [Phycisphaerae bacterium]